jgi:diguanylate cyclase (GGDEF)-like protein/PAS domain S-box-containing protein
VIEAVVEENLVVLRVLLIEAETRAAERLLDALRDGGHSLYSLQVASREEIAEALREEAWDVILLSCALIDLPAVDALHLLSTQATTIPIILTIDRDSRQFPVELLECGARDFVFKSNPARLLAVVERECSLGMLQRVEPGYARWGQGMLEGEERFLQLASNIPECYWLLDAETQQVTYVSKGYEQIWGLYVEALYADSRDWLKHVHSEDKVRLAQRMAQFRMGGLDERFRVLRPDGQVRWLHARNFPVHNGLEKTVSIGGVASDITARVAEQRHLPFFAHFDALTALPNQLMYYDQARHLLALAKRNQSPLGVMVIDIDRFHEVNQTLGHLCGDELLRQVAGRLSGSLRESDVLGRLGGDVFGILLPDVVDREQAVIVARRIVDTLTLPIRVEGQEVFVTASIGTAFHPQDGRDVHELVSNAETAMRHAKTQGRNCYNFYSSTMQEDVRERLFLETDLRNAVIREEFVLYYQPKVSCASGRIVGAEALIRWNHPRRGLVPPDQFIPLLEETGLIVSVGRWVLETASRQALLWQQAGFDLPSVSVNLSARQLQSDTLLDDVAKTLAASGLPPASLDLEITESMLMQNAEQAIHTLCGLKSMGVTLSLDDFGTGYSSLAYLKRFPLDAVKVDRSFVRDIVADSDDASITRAVITMAHHLKLKVVAEGVETAEQLAMLISHQCDVIQGYFFSRPLSLGAMSELLASGRHLASNLLRSGTRKPMALFVAVDGCDEVISSLERAGHRVCLAADAEGALQWFSGNLADVLVCGGPRKGFDALAVIQRAAIMQPQCERILLVDEKQWHRKKVAEMAGSGIVQRVLHMPLDGLAFLQTVEDALQRRHISDEYSRLSHEVEVAERALVNIEVERRRLEAENRELHALESRGYAILQEVISVLPWPVAGLDQDGMLAMINSAATDEFAQRGLSIGMSLAEVLPELPAPGKNDRITMDGKAYQCLWRQVGLGGTAHGQLLILQREAQ